MQRPVIFCDLAGTLEVRRPDTGRWGPWPGVEPVLADLCRDFDLHLTTGEGPASAGPSLVDLGLRDYFTDIHAGLQGGGKPFGLIAASLGVPASSCLAVGDSAASDTAGDTDRTPSVILNHGGGLVDPARLGVVVRALWKGESFLAGFEAALAAAGGLDNENEAGPSGLHADALHASDLGGGSRLGWWRKTSNSRRAVVLLTP